MVRPEEGISQTVLIVIEDEIGDEQSAPLTTLEQKINKINNIFNFRRLTQKFFAFPDLVKNQAINLRDIEQGIDQINRLSSHNAKISLDPSEKSGYSNVKIENKIDSILPTVIGDKNQIIRILNNLFRNAIQSMEDFENGVITIEAKTINEFLVVSIADNGKGIPEDLKEKIFVPYFTTKSSGTGLGLAIVKNMMLGMQGNIRFESIENKGTTFYLYFKLA